MKWTRWLKHLLVWFVIITRTLSALYILVDPFWGFFLTLFFDFVDGYTLKQIVRMSRKEYHQWDKILDWFGYVAMFIVGVQYGIALILAVFLVIRLVGQLMYHKTGNSIYFIFFPNFYEIIFFWLMFMDGWGTTWLVFLLVLRMLEEVWLHYFVPWYLRGRGYPKKLLRVGYKEEIIWE